MQILRLRYNKPVIPCIKIPSDGGNDGYRRAIHGKGTTRMEPRDYITVRIEGEYATLRDTESGDELFIAMALLPEGTDIGTRLHYEMLEYTITDA